MTEIKYGPNMGKEFPSIRSVESFAYNGFMMEMLEGFAPYEIEEFICWTDDPGIGKFKCTDGKIRLIPDCTFPEEYGKTLPPRPKLKPFEGKGVLFGTPSHS